MSWNKWFTRGVEQRDRLKRNVLRVERLEHRLVLDATYHALSGGNFSQNWSDAALITADDNWANVPSIVGYRGDGITAGTGTDPQTLLSPDSPGVVDVIANQANPGTLITGGVAEFAITNPVVALQGSGTADAPYLLLHLDTTGRTDVNISYLLRDIDGSADDAVQRVALQYRVVTGLGGNDFINLPGGFVADASSGPSLATLETPLSVTLPAAAENQAQVQIRIMTTNAVSNDEWVGIDDIVVTSNGPGDTTSPTVTSINRKTPTAALTNAASVAYEVTFSESVTGVDAADFVLAGAGATGATLGTVTGSGTTWTVNVNTGSDGTLGLNLVDDDSIADAAGNKLGGTGNGNGTFTTGQTYTIDRTAPAVQTLVRASGAANPTNAASVDFTVTFTEAVTGVTPAIFTPVGTALPAGAVSVTGSGTTYTVSVATGAGSGTLGLSVAASAAVQDAAGNSLIAFTGGESYTIDKAAPAVISITRKTPASAATNAAAVVFEVKFSEAVTGVDAADFALAGAGAAGLSVGAVGGTGDTYTVSVATGPDGALGLNLVDDGSIDDAAGNGLAGGFTGEAYTIDKTVPYVTGITRGDPASTPTNAAAVTFRVTFSEPVSGVDAADFQANGRGDAIGTVTSTDGGTTWSVPVTTTTDGSLGLILSDDDSILDLAGNALGTSSGPGVGTVISGPLYFIDKTAPAVVQMDLPNGSPTNAASLQFIVSFNEVLTDLDDLTDFAVRANGVTGAAVTDVTLTSPGVYRVTVSTGTGDGTLGLDVVAGAGTDAAGNPVAAYTAGGAYTIDRTPPAVRSVVRVADANPSNAARVHFLVTFTTAVRASTVDVADFALDASGLTGASIFDVSQLDGANYVVAVNTGTGDGTVSIDVVNDGSISDLAGNALAGGFTDGEAYAIDKTAPTVTSIVRASGAANPTNAATVAFTVTFSEAVAGVDAADFSRDFNGFDAGPITDVSGSGDTWTVTVDTGTGGGGSESTYLTINVTGTASVSDLAGNALRPSVYTPERYTIDKIAPMVTGVVRAGGAAVLTNAPSVQFTVTFSESVTDVTEADFGVTGTSAGASVTGVSGGGTTYTVTVAAGGDGTLGLSVAVGAAADAATNVSPAFAGGEAFTIDRTAPAVQSIELLDASPTKAGSVRFLVTFSEPVSGVSESAFQPAGTVSGASVTGVAPAGGNAYTVTVGTGSGSGTLGLSVPAGGAVVDGAGNAVAVASTSDFYTIDKTAPVVQSIVRAGPSPTNAASVSFTVTFSEAVSGVDAGDFAIDAVGVSGAAVGPVDGSGTTWTVAVATGTGSGTLGLTVPASATVLDGVGNALAAPFTGTDLYSLDKDAPTVVTIGLAGASPTNAASVAFTVTFSESVTGVDLSDFAPSGTSGGTVAGVTGSGTTYTVTVSTGGSGTLGLDVADDGSIDDAAGNGLAGPFTGTAFYTIDKAAPAFVSVTPLGASPTNAASVDFLVTFSEAVTGVDASDFALVAPGLAGAGITGIRGGGTAYTVTASTGTGEGPLRLDVVDDDTVRDDAGNALAGGFTGEAVAIDTLAPAVTSITRLDADRTTAATVRFLVTFREAVSGVDADDFALTTTGLVDAAAILDVSGTGDTRTVTVNTGTGNGTIRLDVSGTPTVNDAAGNPLAGGFTAGESYAVSKPVAPAAVTLTANGAGGTVRLRPGQPLTLTATVAEVGTAGGGGTVTFLRNGVAVGTVGITGNLARIVLTGLPVGRYSFVARYDGDNQSLPGSSAAVTVEVGTANTLFVFKAYRDLTGLAQSARTPAWIAALENGTKSRTQVVFEMQRTPEYFTAAVRQAYQALLGRVPTAAEVSGRAGLLAGGQTVPQFRAWLMGQPEYFARRGGGTVAGWRQAVAFDLVRGVASPALAGQLAAALGSVPAPANVAFNMVARSNFVAALTKTPAGLTATVQGLFGRYLGRAADGRLGLFTAQLKQPLGYAQVLAALLGSPSYAP